MSEHCLIKKNTPELRKKLEDAGLSVCICRLRQMESKIRLSK